MSTLDELNKSLDNQDKLDNEVLRHIKELNQLAPKIEERKKERDANRKLLNLAPPDFIEESGPKFLQFEKDNQEILENSIPGLAGSIKNVSLSFNSTGGSALYILEAHNYVNAATGGYINSTAGGSALSANNRTDVPNAWLDSAMRPYNDLASYKLQKTETPMKLDSLFQGLGEKYLVARESVVKAKSGLELQSSSVLAMRSFLEDFWGNVLERARQSAPSLWKGFQKHLLKQSEPRDKVAKSFGNNMVDERKLVNLLRNMADLHNEMSNVGKNLGFDDLDLLNSLFTRWILIIDDMVKFL